MQTIHAIVFITLAVVSGAATAAVVDSRIDSVTIYPGNLAEVTRVAAIELDAGQGELVFAGLPAALVNDSVRIAVTAGDASIGGVEMLREPLGESPRERVRELRAAIEALGHERQDALDRVAAASNEITFIEGLAELPKGEKAAEALTEDDAAANWQTLWERIGNGSREARQRLRTNEREAAELQKEIDTLTQKLNQLGQSRQESVRITVPYRSGQSGNVELALSYRVRGPSWTPRYEARLDTAAGHVRLNRSAHVNQATGEDWRDVHLALSTSQPVYGERPELSSWWIDFAPEAQPMARTNKAVMMESLDATASAAPAPQSARAITVNAEFAATYIIAGRVNVPGNNESRELPIGSDDLEAEIGAETTPQTDPRAWLVAKTSWDGEGPLPPGSVARFRDGAYIGEGRLESWAPGEERTLAFGVDPRIEVSFKPTEDEAGESGWITSKSTLVRRYKLEITNRHERMLPVTALIRMPVPRNEEIKVKADYSDKPTETDVDDDKGIHAWKFDLKPSTTKTMELGYEISYPEGKELSGM